MTQVRHRGDGTEIEWVATIHERMLMPVRGHRLEVLGEVMLRLEKSDGTKDVV